MEAFLVLPAPGSSSEIGVSSACSTRVDLLLPVVGDVIDEAADGGVRLQARVGSALSKTWRLAGSCERAGGVRARSPPQLSADL